MHRWRQLTRWAMVTVAFGASPLVLRGECVSVDWPPLQALRHYKYVFLGRLPQRGSMMLVERSWKGARKTFAFGGLRPHSGDYYLIYAEKEPYVFDYECNLVMPVWSARSKKAITMLDRARGFPPLAVPAEALELPPGILQTPSGR